MFFLLSRIHMTSWRSRPSVEKKMLLVLIYPDFDPKTFKYM